MTQEQWRSITGFAGYYEVSNRGQVRSVHRVIFIKGAKQKTKTITERILRQKVNRQAGRAYARLLVTLCVDGQEYTKNVARLVAEAFIPNPHKLPCVLHRDDNACNNSVDNLEWGTLKENSRQAAERGRIRHGQEHHGSIFTDIERDSAYAMLSANTPVSCVARHFNVSRQAITDLKNGKIKGYSPLAVDRVSLRGSSSKQAKLNEFAVIEIKKLLSEGITHKRIAERYGVSKSTIAAINRGVNWSWLNV